MTAPVRNRIGDFALIKGTDNVGKLIRFGEWLNGDGTSVFSHAALIVGKIGDDWQIIEAEPGGARLNILSAYDQQGYVLSDWRLTPQQRDKIQSAGLSFLGVPYSALDYFSLAALRFHIRPQCVVKYVANTGHVICSQLVDEAYLKADLHMFSDNRFPGDVTPQDLKMVLKGPH